MAKILVVEDDDELLAAVRSCLDSQGYSIEAVQDGEAAKEKLRYYRYDVVIMDWNLPGANGVAVLKDFRNRGGTTPVLLLTGRTEIDDKEVGLDSGADDYLTKPFQPRELLARVRSLLRRPLEYSGTVLRVGNINIELDKQRVLRNDEEVSLLPLEYKLLEFLMRHEGKPFSAEALLERVWDSSSDSGIDAVRTCVKTLRRRIADPDGSSILHTVYGIGYKVAAN